VAYGISQWSQVLPRAIVNCLEAIPKPIFYALIAGSLEVLGWALRISSFSPKKIVAADSVC
jgi:hypothetical protein